MGFVMCGCFDNCVGVLIKYVCTFIYSFVLFVLCFCIVSFMYIMFLFVLSVQV